MAYAFPGLDMNVLNLDSYILEVEYLFGFGLV